MAFESDGRRGAKGTRGGGKPATHQLHAIYTGAVGAQALSGLFLERVRFDRGLNRHPRATQSEMSLRDLSFRQKQFVNRRVKQIASDGKLEPCDTIRQRPRSRYGWLVRWGYHQQRNAARDHFADQPFDLGLRASTIADHERWLGSHHGEPRRLRVRRRSDLTTRNGDHLADDVDEHTASGRNKDCVAAVSTSNDGLTHRAACEEHAASSVSVSSASATSIAPRRITNTLVRHPCHVVDRALRRRSRARKVPWKRASDGRVTVFISDSVHAVRRRDHRTIVVCGGCARVASR